MRLIPRLLLISAALLILTGCAYKFKGSLYDPPQAASELAGVNWDNTRFRLSDLQGKVALVFFGYTNCPDVCPTTLAEMRVLQGELGANADGVAVVFVSVDPDRDTVARLAEYIPVFSDRFYGIHVLPSALEQVKKDWLVVAEKRYYENSESTTKYSVDHTARVYLVGPQGNLRASYPFGTPEEDIRADVEQLLKSVKP